MIDTPYIPPATSNTTQQPSTSLSQQTVIKLPQGITALTPGAILDAVVLRHENSHNSFLQLSANNLQKGELPVAHKLPLANNTSLTLEVLNVSKNLTDTPFVFEARIATINGKPPVLNSTQLQQSFDVIKAILPVGTPLTEDADAIASNRATPSGSATNPNSLYTATTATSDKISLSKGNFITATIVKPASEVNTNILPQNSTSPFSTLNSSDKLTLHILSTQLTSSNTTPPHNNTAQSSRALSQTSNTTTTSTQNISIPGNNTTTPTSESTSRNNPAIRAYQQVNTTQSNTTPSTTQVSSSNTQPPTTSTPATSSNTTSSVQNVPSSPTDKSTPTPTNTRPTIASITQHTPFTATVIGTEKSGETFLSSPLGTLKFNTPTPLPANSSLTLETISLHRSAASPEATDKLQNSRLPTIENQKINFTQTIEEIVAIEKQQQTSLTQHIIPKTATTETGKKAFVAKILWFVSNAYNQNITSWIGPRATEQFQKNNAGNLLNRLESQFSQLQQQFSEPTTNGWNQLFIPLIHEDEAHLLHYYSRHHQDKDTQENHIRFVVEANLSTFGDIQLDGLIKSPLGKNNTTPLSFSLTLRTHDALPTSMRTDILSIFETANAITGNNGSMNFHVQEQFPHLLHDTTTDDDHQNIIV